MGVLADRFEFEGDALDPGNQTMLQGALWKVYDLQNGEVERRLRTWTKTGTSLDAELEELWRHEMRQVARLMRYRDAGEVIVNVLEVLEDDDEFAVLLSDCGDPLTAGPLRNQGRPRSAPIGRRRVLVWRNVARIARALGILHDQAIVHGRLTPSCIFTENSLDPDFRLTGFEWSIRLGGDTEAEPKTPSRAKFDFPCSFRADWAALGSTAAQLLCAEGVIASDVETTSRVADSERRLLRLLVAPRPNEPLDAGVVVRDIKAITKDLERQESGRTGELVLFPNPDELGQALATHLLGAIDPNDFDAQRRWLEADLRTDVRVAPSYQNDRRECILVTNSFRYTIEPMRHAEDWRVGYLKRCTPNDGLGTGTAELRRLKSAVRVSANRRDAIAATSNLGPAAVEWDDYANPPAEPDLSAPNGEDALLAIEIIEAVAETLDAFPVASCRFDRRTSHVSLVLDESEERRRLIRQAGLRPDAERLDKLLGDHDAPWRLSSSPNLGRSTGWDVEVDFLDKRILSDGPLYVFEGNHPPPEPLFLKPPRDQGREGATRRRLRNIAALRGRTDITQGFDDPWAVRLVRPAAELDGPPDPHLDPPKRAAMSLISKIEPYVYVVGPPGVGKTYLVVRLLKRILEQKPNARILLTAQSYEALNNLHAALRKELVPDASVIAIGNDENRFADLHEAAEAVLGRVRECSALAGRAFHGYATMLDRVLTPHGDGKPPELVTRVGELVLHSSNIILAGLNSMTIEDLVADAEPFDWVIVEEAARATGPELAGALALAPRKVLIGDHNQLPPHRVDEVKRRFETNVARDLLGLADDRISFPMEAAELERLLGGLKEDGDRLDVTLARANRLLEPFRSIVEEDERRADAEGRSHQPVSIVLTEQRRMTPAIAEIVSNVFYDGRLKTASGVADRRPPFTVTGPLPDEPVVVIDFPPLQGTDREQRFEERRDHSWANSSEVREVIDALQHLQASRDQEPTLAVLTPYRGQVDLLTRALEQAFPKAGAPSGFRPVRDQLGFVGTVDAFQGSEADVVVLSLVRNNTMSGGRALGFLKDRRRMNVALSRAKHKMVLITSLRFMEIAARGVDPRQQSREWSFVPTLVSELRFRHDRGAGVQVLAPGALQ